MLHRTIPLVAALLCLATDPADADDATKATSDEGPVQELSINVFRNPSIGLEYRRGAVSVHGGLYPTIISKDAMGAHQTSWFVRAGLTHYFLPHAWYGQRPSEVYVSASSSAPSTTSPATTTATPPCSRPATAGWCGEGSMCASVWR